MRAHYLSISHPSPRCEYIHMNRYLAIVPSIRKRLVLPMLLATCVLSGFVGLTAVKESRDDARAVQKGTIIEMPLFSAIVPDKLVVHRDDPRPGFLSLRYPFKGNGSYNVYPLEVSGAQPDIKRAWLAYLEKSGQASHVRRMRIVLERPMKWSGLDAWYHQ